MDITRRNFFKVSSSALVASALRFNPDAVVAHTGSLKTTGAKETVTHCRCCSVGCGLIAHTINGKVINIEGDPENPISRGALCAKGAALIELLYNPLRLTKPMYRAPGSTEWKAVEWDWALDRIAKKVKTTRDRTFKRYSKGLEVNRTDAIFCNGSLTLGNEETNIHQKLMRAWGLVYFDDKSRM